MNNTQNGLAVKQKLDPATVASFGTSGGFSLMLKQANMLSQSTMVPQAYQGNQANCCIALELAVRMQASPFMIMQNTYVVHGNPTFSSKFMVACINTSGRFTSLQYRMTGTKGKDDWGCVAYATDKDTGEVLESPEVTIAIAKAEGWYDKNGSKWKTMPELMLRYRAAAFFCRQYAPEVTMGMLTTEEAIDMNEAEDIEVSLSPIEQEMANQDAQEEEIVKKAEVEEAAEIDVDGLPAPALAPAINAHKKEQYFLKVLAEFGTDKPNKLDEDKQRECLKAMLAAKNELKAAA